MEKEQIQLFRAVRSLIVLHKHCLMLLDDLRSEHDARFEEAGQSLSQMEDFLKEKHGIDVELLHLANHMKFLDEERAKRLRKAILDISNNLQREISQ